MEFQDTGKLYQKIGEFVVCFQWLESRFREIGWMITDPERKQWPPLNLREETNFELINKVHVLFDNFMDSINSEDSINRKTAFAPLVKRAHQLRSYRNILLHSAYIELNAAGEVMSLARSNPKLRINQAGDYDFDIQVLTAESINQEMINLAELAYELNNHYVQVIHWIPIDKKMANPNSD